MTSFRLALLVLVVAGLGGCVRDNPALPVPSEVLHFEVPWANAFPSDVVVDGEGRVWFTDRLTHSVGMFDPESREFRRFETPTPASAPYGIIRAPDGILWFGQSNGRRLGRIDPETGTLTEIPIEGLRSGPHLVAWGAGGVWFTSRRDSAYGHYDPATGRVVLRRGAIPEAYGLATIGATAWIAGRGGRRLYQVSGPEAAIADEPIVVNGGVRRMAAGSEGRIWFTQHNRGHVAGLDPGTGDILTIETLPQPARPYGITVDAWGRVWYAERGNARVVVLDPGTGERAYILVPTRRGTIRHMAVDSERRRAWLPISDAGLIALLEF